MTTPRSHRSQPSLGMRIGVIAAISFALAAWAPALAQDDAGTPAASEGEAKLARLLEGRVAGEPVPCIVSFPTLRLNQIEGAAYVFGRGSTIWVQRTSAPENIRKRDALFTNRINAVNMCRMDVYNTFDPLLGFLTGNVQFVDFVPYTRAHKAAPSEG